MPRAIVPNSMRDLVKDWRMSPGLVSGDHVFLTGFNGCPVDGPPPADPTAQMRIAFDTVAEVPGFATPGVVVELKVVARRSKV